MSVEATSSPDSIKEQKEKARSSFTPTPYSKFLPGNYKVLVTASTEDFDEHVKSLRVDLQEFKMIMVDTQSANRQNNRNSQIEVLQIGTLNGNAYLFKLKSMKNGELNYLRNILADESIVKIGSHLRNDVRKMFQEMNMYCVNWMDIQTIAANAFGARRANTRNQGLKLITKTYTGIELSKWNSETLGSWGDTLSDEQKDYAAQEVMAICDVFCSIYANKLRLQTVNVEDIKAHIAWTKFCSNVFRTNYLM